MISYSTNMKISLPSEPRPLKWWEVRELEANGCRSADWKIVKIGAESRLDRVRDVEFVGEVTIGRIDDSRADSRLERVRLRDCIIGDNPLIRNVGGEIAGARIGSNVTIENVGRIEYEPEALCGVGTAVAVLDETGSRPVWLYPGLTSQLALMMALRPRIAEEKLLPMIEEHYDRNRVPAVICDDAVIRDSQMLINVAVGPEVRIEGALRLVNGMVINNAAPGKGFAAVGAGVDAENFIIEDGYAGSGVLIRNCYIGQGSRLEKGFTAHDSLFFANCSFENGEACAVIAGPYTVSMHKSSLLIGAIYSFMNAGSGSNASNHMYKLGPVHWGVMERGVKTSSGSYMMWGGRIGAFSLLMGNHKSHPDTSAFPFSYLFGDERGETMVVPGMMLKSCGLLRDEHKWPARDRRQKRKMPLLDRICFDVLNPYTVGLMADALDYIGELRKTPADGDRHYRVNGMKIRASALERAEHLYKSAIAKYLSGKLADNEEIPPSDEEPEEWIDLGGQLMPRHVVDKAFEAETMEELENILNAAFEAYPEIERRWIAARLGPDWRGKEAEVKVWSEMFDHAVEEDRSSYLEQLSEETSRLGL